MGGDGTGATQAGIFPLHAFGTAQARAGDGRDGRLSSGRGCEFACHSSLRESRIHLRALSLPLSGPMTAEVLTVEEMYAADRFAVEHGVPSLELMDEAGLAVANEICRRWSPCSCAVMCGPGNNGGDGFVVARELSAHGFDVWVETAVNIAQLKGDAAVMAKRWTGETISLEQGRDAEVFVDALFGAGLSRPLEGAARSRVQDLKEQQRPVVAIDVPSGIHGDTAKAFDDVSIDASLTVTFFRKKPAHLLLPAALQCGEVVVADIGIPEAAIAVIKPK